ncbi:hypothetical protein ACHAW6_006295, partial [Cyclotella cf. meneghiniana]
AHNRRTLQYRTHGEHTVARPNDANTNAPTTPTDPCDALDETLSMNPYFPNNHESTRNHHVVSSRFNSQEFDGPSQTSHDDDSTNDHANNETTHKRPSDGVGEVSRHESENQRYHDEDSSSMASSYTEKQDSIHLEDDDDGSTADVSSSSSNIVEIIQLPLAGGNDDDHNLSISEQLDILRGCDSHGFRLGGRRHPFRVSSSSSSSSSSYSSSSSSSSSQEVALGFNGQGLPNDRRGSQKRNRKWSRPPRRYDDEIDVAEEDLSRSTRRLDSEEEYLETSWLPIQFENYNNPDSKREVPRQRQQQQQRMGGNAAASAARQQQQQQQQKTQNRHGTNKNDRRQMGNSSELSKNTDNDNSSSNNNNKNNNSKNKTLSPTKQDKRHCLRIFLLLLCIGAAGVAITYWFVVYYLGGTTSENQNKNKQKDPIYVPPNSNDKVGTAANATTKRPMDAIQWDGDAECANFTIEVITDRYGNETHWVLSYLPDGDNKEVVAQDPQSTEEKEDNVDYERSISRASSLKGKRNRLRQHNTQWQRKLKNKDNQQQQQQQQDSPWNHSQPSQSSQELLVGYGGPYMYHNMAQSSTNPITNSHNATYCLAKGSYKFDIYDANGDGFCCRYGNGSYSLYFVGGRVVQSSSFEDEPVESTEFEVTDDDIPAIMLSSSGSPSILFTPPLSLYPPSMAPYHTSSSSVKRMATASWSEMLTDVSKSYGLVFDIQTNRNISSLVIVGMEMLVYAPNYIQYEVWTMPGSWRDIETSESAAFYSLFLPVANGTMLGRGVCEDCGFSSIPLEEFQDVVILGADTLQSFWVTLSSDDLVFKKHDNTEIVQSSCDSFTVNVGSAVLVYPLESVDPTQDLSDNRGFLGAIQYESVFRDIAGASYPTLSPVANQSLQKTESPSTSTAQSQSPLSGISYEPKYDTGNPTLSNSPTASLIPTVLNKVIFTPSSSLLPSSGPSSNESSDNFTIPFDNNTNKINYTVSITASDLDVSNSSLAPTLAMFGNSTDDTTIARNHTINNNSTVEMNITEGTEINVTSPLYNYTEVINSTEVTPTPSGSSDASSLPFSSSSPSPGPSSNATALGDSG